MPRALYGFVEHEENGWELMFPGDSLFEQREWAAWMREQGWPVQVDSWGQPVQPKTPHLDQVRANVKQPVPDHTCDVEAVPVRTDGALGHGFACQVCGRYLQAG